MLNLPYLFFSPEIITDRVAILQTSHFRALIRCHLNHFAVTMRNLSESAIFPVDIPLVEAFIREPFIDEIMNKPDPTDDELILLTAALQLTASKSRMRSLAKYHTEHNLHAQPDGGLEPCQSEDHTHVAQRSQVRLFDPTTPICEIGPLIRDVVLHIGQSAQPWQLADCIKERDVVRLFDRLLRCTNSWKIDHDAPDQIQKPAPFPEAVLNTTVVQKLVILLMKNVKSPVLTRAASVLFLPSALLLRAKDRILFPRSRRRMIPGAILRAVSR
jgi:hypothetical protein